MGGIGVWVARRVVHLYCKGKVTGFAHVYGLGSFKAAGRHHVGTVYFVELGLFRAVLVGIGFLHGYYEVRHGHGAGIVYIETHAYGAGGVQRLRHGGGELYAQKVGVDVLAHHVALGLVLVLVAGGGNAGYAEGDVALLLGDHVIGELAVLSYGEGEGIPIDAVALIVGYLYVAYLLVAVVGKVEGEGDACGGSLTLYHLDGYSGIYHAKGYGCG